MTSKRRWTSRFFVFVSIVLLCSGCGRFVERELHGVGARAPGNFEFLGDKYPCYLELEKGEVALRVNCFEIDGSLHIHSSRWANLPRFEGESWRDRIRRRPEVRVEIEEKIYTMTATVIDNEELRRRMLKDRGYIYPWAGITIFRFEAISESEIRG
jgi:hypothetical protein|tara:strand:+ start:3541 stop:4008 length:468 start_codon:yes stop_codon:yes gene_type:complete